MKKSYIFDYFINDFIKGISPFFWPLFSLVWPFFSLGSAFTPLSTLSWGYSTWLLFIIPVVTIPLVITVFAPTRTFSGPLRYGYLQHASYLTSLLSTLFGTFITTLKSLPTLALPLFFFLPVLPMLFFVFLSTLPVALHYVAFHYRRRLKEITTSASGLTARLEVALVRARRAAILAHTYEGKALDITSTTCRTASHTLNLHSTNFFDAALSAWAAVAHTTGHAEGVFTAARDVVQVANNVRQSQFPRDEVRPPILAEILFKNATDAEAAASHAKQLAHQARESVVWSEKAQSQAERARQQVQTEAENIRTMGLKLANTVANVETQIAAIENEAEKVRATLEQAVSVAVEGDMDAAEELVADAESSFGSAVQRPVDQLCLVVGEARRAWVDVSVKM